MDREANYLKERAKWLDEHDKALIEQTIDRFKEELEKTIKEDINDEIISMFDGGTIMEAVEYVAEQLKEQNK